MLKKLLKYEIPVLGRKLAPLYLAWLAASVMLGLSLRVVNSKSDLFMILSTILYIGIVTAIGVMTVILIIQRFNQSLLGDGGYFNLVLPVTAGTHILNKVIASLIWLVLSGLAGLLSGLIILLMQEGAIQGFLSLDWGYFFSQFRGIYILYLLEFIVMCLCSFAKSILGIYTALAIGHQARNRVTLASIGAYIGVMVFEGIIAWVMTSLNLPTNFMTEAEFGTFALLGIAVSLFMAAVYFLTCRYFMSRRLNLA